MSAPTRENVAEWARMAATKVVDHDFAGNPITDADAMLLGAFGPLVHRLAELAFAAGAAAEREACAKLVLDDAWALTFQTFGQYRAALAAAIRARGQA